MRKGLLATLVLAFGALLLTPGPCRSATWVVDTRGIGDATALQEGIDLASDGDSVLVRFGNYRGPIEITQDDLTILGTDGAHATKVDMPVSDYCLALAPGVSRAVIAGLSFTGALGGYDYGIARSVGLDLHGDVEIRDCILRDNVCNAGSAIVGSGDLLIVGTIFSGNVATDDFGGNPDCGVPCIDWVGSLEVDGCRFVGNRGGCRGLLRNASGIGTVRNSVFEANEMDVGSGALFEALGSTWIIENNLVFANRGLLSRPTFLPMELSNNTFAANVGFAAEVFPVAAGSIIRGNVFTGAAVGAFLPAAGGGLVIECNDSWGNEVNWMGFDPTGVNGNVSLPPLYCDAGGGVFTVASNSPLLPANNSCGVTIGAYGVGCGVVSIAPMTWGAIKSQYR